MVIQAMYTLDTNVLVYNFRKDPEVVGFIQSLYETLPFSSFVIPTIVIAEFKSKELNIQEIFFIDSISISNNVVNLDRPIADIAGSLRAKYPSLKLPDAIIAATAIHTKTTLITRNVKDFRKIEGLRVQGI